MNFGKVWEEHKAWAAGHRDERSRVLTVERRLHGRRAFTEAQLRAVFATSSKLADMAQKLNCSTETVRFYCCRYGLKFTHANAIAWTEALDAIVARWAKGEISLNTAERLIKAGDRAIKKRAVDLGLEMPKRRWWGNERKLDSKLGNNSTDNPISVGRSDRLLERLFAVHKEPRNKVYSGVR